MNYKMEELAQIVAGLAEKYTAKESTSITYERAEQFMGAVLYCIREVWQQKENSIISREGMSALQAYETGFMLVEQKVKAAKKAAKENISVILDLYQAVMPQMVTDVSLDEVAYLAPLLVDYRFSDNSFYTMTGETVAGEQFEEFYVDETALYELILEVFYEKVESME